MRVRDWYFRGWEKQKDGNGKLTFVYVGEYYGFPGGTKPLKRPVAVLTAALIAAYILVAFFPSAGGMWRIAAIPQLLTLIPLIYLAMGALCLLRAPERLTYRDYHASWRRVRHAAIGCTVTTSAMAAVELVFIALALKDGAAVGAELFYLLRELLCAALCAALVRFVKKHPCSQFS